MNVNHISAIFDLQQSDYSEIRIGSYRSCAQDIYFFYTAGTDAINAYAVTVLIDYFSKSGYHFLPQDIINPAFKNTELNPFAIVLHQVAHFSPSFAVTDIVRYEVK